MKRNPSLCCVLALAFTVGILILIKPVRADSPITVTTTSDVIASDGLCSLREAIIAANTDSAFSDCPGGSGADTINFSPNLPVPATFILTHTGANEDAADTGDLDIIGTLTINGAGVENTLLDGNGTDRVLETRPGARVTIAGVTIRNGNPGTTIDGGGIKVDLTSVLTLTNSTVISNTAVSGGGIKVLGLGILSNSTVDANQGGGITNDGGGLMLSNVNIINNTGDYGIRNQNHGPFTFDGGLVSGNQGGGIYNSTSSATLSNLSIVSNTGGGGVYNSGATLTHLTMNHCVVMSNTATSGGGIFNGGVGAQADIYNTSISGNTATAAGGGVYNNGSMILNGSTIDHNHARTGGGIDQSGGSLHLTNDTLSSNTASDNGGGLYNRSDTILTNVTFNGNTASGPETGGNIFNVWQLATQNTIVANSEADGNCFNSDGFLNSLGHNLDSANTCGFGAMGDLTNTNPLLGPLQDNGGATLTHALLPGSPAIDTGDNNGCPLTDQRGVSRPQGAICDIGAFEVISGGEANLSITKDVSPDPVDIGATLIYTLAVSNAGPDSATAVSVTDTLPFGVTYGGVSGNGWSCGHAGGMVTCTRPSLAVGAAPNIVITVTAPASGLMIINTAIVSGHETDPNTGDNTATANSKMIPNSVTYLPLILKNFTGASP